MDIVLLQAIINGVLLGGLYAAYSAGFSLVFGVMGVVNLAHGEMVMLGAFASYWMFELYGLDPYLCLPLSATLLFAFGYLVQRLLINRMMGRPHIMSYLLTFGIHLIVANTAVKLWTHDFRTVTTAYSGSNISLMGLTLPSARLVTFGLALAVVAALWFYLNHTENGRAIKATAMDKETARLMGVPIHHIYALTFGIGAAATGLAGASLSPITVIYPEMGLEYTITAFCVVVLGGMGYMPGVLCGGLILGVTQSLATTYATAGISMAMSFFILFVMLLVRPKGVLGRGSAA